MLDFFHAVDWIVPDPVTAAQRFAELYPTAPFKSSWVQELPSHQYCAVFSRAQPTLANAPTRLEFIRTIPGGPAAGCSVAPLERISAWHDRRPQRTHATVMCVADFDRYVDELKSRGVPVWIEPGCAHLPHRRGWIGWTPDGGSYIPGFDGGLYLEFIPTEALGGLMSQVQAVPGPATRVERRVHIVADLDAVVRTLEISAGLVADPIRDEPQLGARVARIASSWIGGAAFDLVEPVGDGPAASYMSAWGEGPWITTLAIPDVPDTLDRALDAGAKTINDGDGAPILIDSELGGILVELTEITV